MGGLRPIFLFLDCKQFTKTRKQTFFPIAKNQFGPAIRNFLHHAMETSETSPNGSKIEKNLSVQNKTGIHARPAAMIVRVTNKYTSEIFFEKDEEQVNGKSIMGLMMLAAGRGSSIKAIIEGSDAQDMMKDLEDLFNRKFDEG
jgi:phosphocarrier protein HPr